MPISHTLEEMVQKFTAKMNPTQVGTNYQNAKTLAVDRYMEGTYPYFALTPKIKNILGQYAVPAGQQVIYFAFAYKLQHYATHQQLAELDDITSALEQEFVTLGADPAVLSQVSNLVVG